MLILCTGLRILCFIDWSNSTYIYIDGNNIESVTNVFYYNTFPTCRSREFAIVAHALRARTRLLLTEEKKAHLHVFVYYSIQLYMLIIIIINV